MNRRTFLALGATLCAGTLLPLGLSGCGTGEQQQQQETELPHNTYDWDNLTQDKDELRSYTGTDGSKAFRGVDLSNHDSDLDWDGFVDDGIEFVMLRVGYRGYTEGGLFDDDTFQDNYEQAIAHGIAVGIYFFSQALTVAEAEEEADFVNERLKGLEIGYPVAYDLEKLSGVEDRAESLSVDEATQNTIAFCDKIASYGYTPIVYGNSFWFSEDVDFRELATRYDIWLAEYDDKPDFVYEFTMWQYAESGTDSTTYGQLDLDLCFKDYRSLISTSSSQVSATTQVSATSQSASSSQASSTSGSASGSQTSATSRSASGSQTSSTSGSTSGSASGSASGSVSGSQTIASTKTKG